MNNIDLPDYLKNSKLLNNLSVRQLLQYWALICATAVVILSLAAVITNDLISDKQAQLNKTAIPIDTAVRSLGNILTNFELREEKLLDAKNKDELENYLSRQNLDQSFNDQLSRLSSRVSELHRTTSGSVCRRSIFTEPFCSRVVWKRSRLCRVCVYSRQEVHH